MSKKIKNNLPDDLNGSQDNLENVRKDLNSDNMKDEGLKDNIKIENAIAAGKHSGNVSSYFNSYPKKNEGKRQINYCG